LDHIENIKKILKKCMPDDLYRHSVGTCDYSIHLLERHLQNFLNAPAVYDEIKDKLKFCKLAKQGTEALTEFEDKVYRDVAIAALLHDYGKIYNYRELLDIIVKNKLKLSLFEKNNPHIIHSFAAPFLLERDFGIKDPVILGAVRQHTTGSLNMNFIDKIIYISDKLEASRDFENIKNLRKLSETDINLCLLEVYKSNIIYVINRGYLLYPDTSKIWNYICGGLKNATKR
jgi:predicted HD superfamily hydrolase involved in NAD metabolism